MRLMMSIRILRQDVFPFTCKNPACNREYDVEDFMNVINLRGLIFADCGDTIYQGITCECNKPNLIPVPRNNPIVDLRDFIIIPNTQLTNLVEQIKACDRVKDNNDLLNFKFIPAWDEVAVSYDEILRFYHNWFGDFRGGDFSPIDIPYIMTPEDVSERLNEENTSGNIQLRRLYPDIPKFKNLLICLSPNRITGFDFEDGSGARAEGDTPREIQWRNSAWTELLEDVAGKSLKETVIEHLQSREVSNFNEDLVDDEITRQLFYMNYDPANRIGGLSRVVGFETKVWDYVKEELNKFLYPVCTKIALDKSRKELLGWTNFIEKGKALFVDAPMGLGKTYAIVEALAENPEMSAVIFMPTIRLCEEIVNRLRNTIVSYKFREKIDRNEEVLPYYHIKYLKDKYGNDEVYHADGINENNCPNFNEIKKRYNQKWIIKKDLCESCEKKEKEGCRFILHRKNAPLSRIVVTTHHQYDRFYDQESIRKWHKHGYDNPDKAVNRDFFIVDEDIILSKCYQPIQVKYDKLIDSVATVREFLKKFEGMDENILKIDSLFSQISLCKKTAVVKSIDPDFALPKKIIKDWNESFYKQYSFIPDILDDPGIIGNHLEIIENGLRLGVVVQKHGTVNKVHFPNPKTYDLSNLPPHIFFDGTMIDKEFLKKKLHNVKFDRMKIDVKVPWKLRVWQNVNTDLPTKWIARDEHNVKKFVRELINGLGMDHKYFFITTKKIRNAYLDNFIDQEYPNLNPVIVHYGSLRGINEANECDIGIMIGSCLISDTVEIAMTLEFIQDNLPKQEPIPTENNLWTWEKSKSQRVYKDEYAIVGKMAKAFRLNEHRQAIARTRYLFHDVDFYILSKDPVDEYEKYATVKDYQYRNDIFPPRKKRSDADVNYEKAKEKVYDWLSTHETVIPMEIHKNYGIGRHSASDYLKRMLNDGLLVKEGKTKYKLPPKTENGQDSL